MLIKLEVEGMPTLTLPTRLDGVEMFTKVKRMAEQCKVDRSITLKENDKVILSHEAAKMDSMAELAKMLVDVLTRKTEAPEGPVTRVFYMHRGDLRGVDGVVQGDKAYIQGDVAEVGTDVFLTAKDAFLHLVNRERRKHKEALADLDAQELKGMQLLQEKGML